MPESTQSENYGFKGQSPFLFLFFKPIQRNAPCTLAVWHSQGRPCCRTQGAPKAKPHRKTYQNRLAAAWNPAPPWQLLARSSNDAIAHCKVPDLKGSVLMDSHPLAKKGCGASASVWVAAVTVSNFVVFARVPGHFFCPPTYLPCSLPTHLAGSLFSLFFSIYLIYSIIQSV